MKTSIYVCLESLMCEATGKHNQAVEKYKKTLKAYLDGKVPVTCHDSAKDELNSASQRMHELVITKKIIDEMEQKGVEL